MKALTLTLTVTCLSLAACGPNTGDAINSHDTGYASIDVDSDTCTLDTVTGLTWQTKTNAAGLHNADNTYSWFDPTEANSELDFRGVEDGGTCQGSSCDTWHYVKAVNRAGFCGYHDWRMPSKDELFSISDLRRAINPPTINSEFFPHTQVAEYWSGNDYSFQYDTAWVWNFEYGHDRVDWKKEAKFVRLVRGTAGKLESAKN